MNTNERVSKVLKKVEEMLHYKNHKYGDSALNPIRIMSKAGPIEQILVRIDDKLNRIKQGNNLIMDDEDVILDLMGYLVLLKIALDEDYAKSYNSSDYEY